MALRLRTYEATGFDPYENLATEQYLLQQVQPGECILYLWQNKNTVVIGRNQNPWTECRISLLEQESGKLARRLSGGGAVFHDLGNLNFTFLTCTEHYDVDKQLSVIQTACKLAGIEAEKSGRNDLLAQGRKFSGNAFYHSQGHSYHHGTLLIRSDMEQLQRYLSPPKAKLEAKGIRSVRSRVINLSELAPELDIASMQQRMIQAFEAVYQAPAQPILLSESAKRQIRELALHIGSWEYLFGTPLPFGFECAQQFSWGHIQLCLQAKAGTITHVAVYSDAMDWQLPEQIQQALTGCCFRLEDMVLRLRKQISDETVCADLCELLRQQEL